MKAILGTAFLIVFAGCATNLPKHDFAGTWKMRLAEPYVYYLRIYPNGAAAIWPSPPDGETSWTKLDGDYLVFHYDPPLRDPRLSRRGPLLLMHDNVSTEVFDRMADDIEPPK